MAATAGRSRIRRQDSWRTSRRGRTGSALRGLPELPQVARATPRESTRAKPTATTKEGSPADCPTATPGWRVGEQEGARERNLFGEDGHGLSARPPEENYLR